MHPFMTDTPSFCEGRSSWRVASQSTTSSLARLSLALALYLIYSVQIRAIHLRGRRRGRRLVLRRFDGVRPADDDGLRDVQHQPLHRLAGQSDAIPVIVYCLSCSTSTTEHRLAGHNPSRRHSTFAVAPLPARRTARARRPRPLSLAVCSHRRAVARTRARPFVCSARSRRSIHTPRCSRTPRSRARTSTSTSRSPVATCRSSAACSASCARCSRRATSR